HPGAAPAPRRPERAPARALGGPPPARHGLETRQWASLFEGLACWMSIGQIGDGQKDGEAVVVLQRGVYKGQLVGGEAHGQGTFEAAEGDVYQGQWKNNQADGQGQYTGRDGRTYDGQWSHDTQHGQGVETWADGITYRGQFDGGQKHGNGKFTWKDGSSYEGQFQNNNI
ncbi:unnamed protein product, partial [Prorocentrum cordatum]